MEGDAVFEGVAYDIEMISIHALRVEGDPSAPPAQQKRRDFYPRPPGGGRPFGSSDYIAYSAISIHALRVEGDHKAHGARVA